jgi:hypothetical protein
MSPDESDTPRSEWVANVYRLGDAPGDDLSATTTAEERLAMVEILSARMWELTGKPIPLIPRAELPVRVVRRT